MNSRGAATECSPGREPGVSFDTISAPEGRKSLSESFAPPGLRFRNDTYPGLGARGYTLTPLRGCLCIGDFSPLRRGPRLV